MELKAQHLSVGYGTKTLIKEANFSLSAGQVLCLLGSNGCGKSTLLRTLLGLLTPLSGKITLNNQPLQNFSAAELACHIAYVPQAQSSVFSWTVLDAVLFGVLSRLKPLQQPGQNERDQAQDALTTLGIAHLAKRTFNTLSGGEQQLVLLARALTQQAPLLILDEPTASLDVANQIQVLEQIQHLREQGFGILLCTHHSDHARLCADQLLLIKNQSLHQHEANELKNTARLAWLYGVSETQVKKYLSPALG